MLQGRPACEKVLEELLLLDLSNALTFQLIFPFARWLYEDESS